jgi:hypothetical protein
MGSRAAPPVIVRRTWRSAGCMDNARPPDVAYSGPGRDLMFGDFSFSSSVPVKLEDVRHIKLSIVVLLGALSWLWSWETPSGSTICLKFI